MKLESVIAGMLGLLPVGMYQKIRDVLSARNRQWLVGRCDLYRCAHHKLGDLNRATKVCHIRKGLYDYQYFNICFVNNMISLIVEAVAQGMVPRIEIINDKGENIWETFFLQPYHQIDTSQMESVEWDLECGKCFPAFDEIYQDRSIFLWGEMYQQFVCLNEKSKNYVDAEVQKVLGEESNILGILCRGTDYTETKPKGHPVQPEIAEVMDYAEQKMQELGCGAIYLATEDGKIDKAFRERFPGKIRINQRRYYDELFDENGLQLIKDVHFDREDDDYWKGMEYLSSLVILSRCESLIAGNCGGSQMAVFMNGGKYRYCKIYNLGLYQ